TVNVISNTSRIQATGPNGVAINATNVNVIANAGVIQAGGSRGTAIFASDTATVNNLKTGSILGGILAGTLNVTNASGGVINGITSGIMGSGSVTNAGRISGGKSVTFTGAGTNTLTLQTGSLLVGDAVGSTGATNNLILQGSGEAHNNFVNFNALNVQGTWSLNGNSAVASATVESGGSLAVGGDNGHASAVLTGGVTVDSRGGLSGGCAIPRQVHVLDPGTVVP